MSNPIKNKDKTENPAAKTEPVTANAKAVASDAPPQHSVSQECPGVNPAAPNTTGANRANGPTTSSAPPNTNEKCQGGTSASSETANTLFFEEDISYGASTFREEPLKHILEEAENAHEALLYKLMADHYSEHLETIRYGNRCKDPIVKLQILERAMAFSKIILEVSDAIGRLRRNGKQEFIVKHQDSEARPDRRRHARPSVIRKSNRRMSSVKRSVST